MVKKISKACLCKQGFTLIELLIVMAILGVLAVVVLVAINPVQQLARTRDTGRKSAVTQVGHALAANFTARNGRFIRQANCGGNLDTWMACVQTMGELASVPSAIAYTVAGTSACVAGIAALTQYGVQNNLCYAVTSTGDQAVVYATMESNTEISKCTVGSPYFVWSSHDGRAGLVCSASVPLPGGQSWNTPQ